MKKVCIAISIALLLGLILVGCNSQTTAPTETAEISNDLSTINYNGQLYGLCPEDKSIPEDAVKINSVVEDETLWPLIDFNDLYQSDTYPEYLWLYTSINQDYREFRKAQKGFYVLYKLQS